MNEPRILDPRDFVSRPAWVLSQAVAYLIALGLLGWFAHARITTPPAAQSGGAVSAADTAPGDVAPVPAEAAALSQALIAIPIPATADFLNMNLLFALHGEWDEDTAPADARAMDAPATAAAFDDLILRIERAAEAGVVDRICASYGDPWSAGASGGWDIRQYTYVHRSLVIRARNHVMRNDLDAALTDLFAAERLDRGVGSFLESQSTFSGAYLPLPVWELSRLAVAGRLSADQARRAIAVLIEEDGLSLTSAWRGLSDESAVDALLDRHFTRDARDDGWLVVSTLQSRWSHSAGERSPVWNLMSPLFHGRADARERMLSVTTALRRAEQSPRAEVISSLPRLNFLSGPVGSSDIAMKSASIDKVFRVVAARREAVIMLALAAYHAERGAYPESLDALAPAYLDRTPLDLESGGPYDYVLSGDGYWLGSSAGRPKWPEYTPYEWYWGAVTPLVGTYTANGAITPPSGEAQRP